MLMTEGCVDAGRAEPGRDRGATYGAADVGRLKGSRRRPAFTLYRLSGYLSPIRRDAPKGEESDSGSADRGDLAGGLGALVEQHLEAVVVQDGDAERERLVVLGPGALTHHHEVGLLRHRSGHLPAA